MKTFNLIIRIIILPLWAALYLIKDMIMFVKVMVHFVKYGGEMITYVSKDETKKIYDIWRLLKGQYKREEDLLSDIQRDMDRSILND